MTASKVAAAAALVFAAAIFPAREGLFDDAEARRRIDELRQELAKQGNDNEARIAKLEELIRNIGVVELVRSIDQMNAEIARLNGQIEVLQNENQQLQKRQRDFYLDIDSRLKRLEGNPAAAGAAGAATVPPGPNAAGGVPPAPSAGTTAPPVGAASGASPPPGTSAAPAASAPGGSADFGPTAPVGTGSPRTTSSREEQAREVRAYDAASNLFRRNDFGAAIDAFKAFVRDHPTSALASNANYWIGISYANMRDYKSALAAQSVVLEKYPQSPKAPDAMLAIAAIRAEQGDNRAARSTLEDIIARYPQSDAAGKARTRLATLRPR